MAKQDGLVYSTDGGHACPGCGRPRPKCSCRPRKGSPAQPTDGVVRVGRATQGRKGKGVTTVTGVPLPPAELAWLAKELKQMCGSGGAVKNGTIEIQGEHRDRIVQVLEARGWTVRRAGG